MPDETTRRRPSGEPLAWIRQAILDGELNPNERLVEEDLRRHLGCTRATIRQALAVLEQQGLVVRERNRGARVRMISADEAIEIMEIRAVIEALIARHAARRVTPKDVKNLRAMLVQLESLSAKQDFVGYSLANVAFHAEIARLAQNPSAARILNGLRSQTIAFQFRPILEPGRAAEIDAEHRTVVAALAERDEVAAEAAMRVHIDNVGRALRTAIASRQIAQRSMIALES
jgi:DNA-binding GntR family transcriptional regulator